MSMKNSRRDFLRKLGVSAAAANFLFALPSLGWAASQTRKKRLVFLFSPNGVIPKHFWPDQEGKDFDLKRILAPLAPFQDQLMTLQGVDNKIRGDGDGHMRGIGCLLTGIELFPGDVQGGSDTPAGWSQGISIDQHLKTNCKPIQAPKRDSGRWSLVSWCLIARTPGRGCVMPDRINR